MKERLHSSLPNLRFRTIDGTKSHYACAVDAEPSFSQPPVSHDSDDSSDSDMGDVDLSKSLGLGDSIERMMYHVAQTIRHDIKQLPRDMMEWPPSDRTWYRGI